MSVESPALPLTHGHLLGGRIKYAQPRPGFRSGIEPVLLAATIAARPGELVLEAGTGAGAALLCLAARVSGIEGYGVERDASLALLAAQNGRSNNFGTLHFVAASVEQLPLRGGFAQAFANPPYHRGDGTASVDPMRASAKRADPDLLARWAKSLGQVLRHRGALTFIVPAAGLTRCLSAFDAADCGSAALLPLWRRIGEPGKLIILQAVKGGKGPCRVLPGLILHEADGSFTEAAQAVLRGGAALQL